MGDDSEPSSLAWGLKLMGAAVSRPGDVPPLTIFEMDPRARSYLINAISLEFVVAGVIEDS